MSLRAEGHIAARPWLDATPVSVDSGHLLNLGHTFMGLLAVVEVAVELVPDVSAEVLFELDSARTSLSSALSARPVLIGPLLRALDDAADAVDRLLDWMCATQVADTVALVRQLDHVRDLQSVESVYRPDIAVRQFCPSESGGEHG